jgi:PhnB protein
MSESWKPSGYTSVSPYLITENAGAVVDFLVRGLSGSVLRRFEDDDGSIIHAEVRLDDTVVMLGQAGPDWPAVPSHLHVYVPDVDAAFQRAVDEGGEVVQSPVRKEGDPDRRGGVGDPGGNTWWLATQVEG